MRVVEQDCVTTAEHLNVEHFLHSTIKPDKSTDGSRLQVDDPHARVQRLARLCERQPVEYAWV